MTKKSSVLFVCLGNICRSPAAEGIFEHFVREKALESKYIIDSAGTSGHHDGEMADPRMLKAAKNRNIELKSISRKFTSKDFLNFDCIVVMDDSNYENVMNLDTQNSFSHKVFKMTDFSSGDFKDLNYVPDPYFGGEEGFENVLNLLENACSNLLDHLEK